MPSDPSAHFILIVTGSTLRGEEMDRPLAYYLKQQIERALAVRAVDDDYVIPSVIVIADFRWMNEEILQIFPTISVGGPGVNALAQRWLEDLPLSLAVDNQYYIHMDPELTEARASLWGMDNPNTQIAVALFVERFLSRFLDRAEETSTLLPDEDDSED
jgi:hypothetical protein